MMKGGSAAGITWRRLLHWGPLTALGIIKSVTFMMVHCCSMWWPPSDSLGGFLNTLVFLALSGLTIYNFIDAVFEGPGYLPYRWKPEDPQAERYLQFCGSCEGFKAPRAHHCRKCGRCVLKMDHHCPWINNCVGHLNHGHFTAFLLFAVCGCLQATVCLSCCLYRALNRVWYLYYGDGSEPLVYLGLPMLVLCVFCLGLSIGVVLAVGMLLYFQVRAILRNRTGIEDWIVEKARHRRKQVTGDGGGAAPSPAFVFPYDLGWKDNFKQVLNLSLSPRGDGVSWPVREGCDQFTLTVEQQEQKLEKRERTRRYLCGEGYSGAWLPLTKGLRVVCSLPLTDEPRLKLTPGDTVLVTRWRGRWLFGQKEGGLGGRGWFPRRCVVELVEARHSKDKAA